MKNIVLIFIMLMSNLIHSQENFREKNMVGFSCFFEGRQTNPVKRIEKKVKNRDYKKLSNFLNSSNASEKYLAVIVLERLDSMSRYKLSKIEIKLIEDIKKSKEGVYICSGCIIDGKIEIKELFNGNIKILINIC